MAKKYETLSENGHQSLVEKVFTKVKGVTDTKVDKVSGKGLSTNDYTTAEKNKLAGIAAGAQVNTVTSVAGKTGAVTLSNSDVGLSNVGNYKSVSVTAQTLTDNEKSQARINIGAGTSSFSGSYTDLTNKPTIPTVNDATLTIQKNGTTVQTFTANQATDATANITVPTKVSELTNDSGYTTNTGTVTSVKVGTTSYNPSSGVVSLPAYPTVPTKVSQLTNDAGYTTNTGTVTSVKVGSTSYGPSSGVVSLPAYPTTLPASDVSAWAKAASKPTYTASEVGAATSDHTHTTSLATSTGTSTVSLAASTKYALTAGGTSVIFTTPPNTTYESKAAASGGTAVSLVTTGEKYIWNSKTSNTGTITGVSVNGTSVATSGVANITSVPASILSGAISNGVTATTQSAGDNSTKVATTAYVDTAIDNLPEPMIFKGSLGTGGTITSLPTAAADNEGFTYKVITAGTYASKAAKVGDTFISNGSEWILIPSGDEPSGTVTSVTLKATSPIAIDSTAAITSSGTRTLSHANSGVTAGTYKSVTVNATGHVTAGTNPTTLAGYGITDAASSGHTHTTSLAADSGTSSISLAANTKYKLTAGGTSVIFTTPVDNNTTYESKAAASGGTAVSLVTTGEKYTWNNKSNLAIGTTASTAAAGNHTHTTSLATSTGTNQLTLAASTKYALTAGGTSYVFTTPADTTYESKAAASGGTAISLVTTGEKYTWNNKSNLTIGTTATTAAAGNHTHKYAGSATAGGPATTLAGTYSGSGGQLAPNTVSGGNVKAVMMNNPKGITGFNTYCDCLLMDTYTGTDVPIVTGIGLSKKGTSSAADTIPRAYIFNGIKGNTTTWANMAEVVTTKNIKTATVGSASAGTAIAADDITAWSAGTAPSLTVTSVACDDITAWSAGTLPTLGTAIPADDITAWSAGSLPSLTYNSTNHSLTFSQGSLPSLSYTAKSIPNVTGVGTLPSLSYTAKSVGSASNWSAGTVPSLSYTARSIPNISVTSTTVATGGIN